MRIVHIRGLSGLVVMVAFGLLAVLAALLLPAAFVLVLWNAFVFEGMGGPEIALGQAVLLWSAVLALLNLIFQPQFSFEFKRISEFAVPGKAKSALDTAAAEVASTETQAADVVAGPEDVALPAKTASSSAVGTGAAANASSATKAPRKDG
jgi:hypothetical protein